MNETRAKFPLIDGRCPVCDTPVETLVDGVRVRFLPHDDPDWCREAAKYNALTLRRALEQAHQDRALAQQREAFYRQAFARALRHLEHMCLSEPDGEEDARHWRERIEEEVAHEMQRASERAMVAAALASAPPGTVLP